jgi:hypothetical protein
MELHELIQIIGVSGGIQFLSGFINKAGENTFDGLSGKSDKVFANLRARFKKPETQAALVEAQTALAALPEAPTEAQQEAALAPLNQQIANEAASNPEFADEWQKFLAEQKALHVAKSGRTVIHAKMVNTGVIEGSTFNFH